MTITKFAAFLAAFLAISPALGQTTRPPAASVLTGSEQDAMAALERSGYTQIRDMNAGPEGISAKAVKDGREVSVVVDSDGKIKQQ
jgi:hypothetical protein